MQNKPGSQVIVGVDGSPASIEALIQGQRLAAALGAEVHALACWDFPHIYDGYVAMGIEGLEERWHRSWPRLCRLPSERNFRLTLRTRLVNGGARQILLDASKDARMLVVGRRGHGGFGGLLLAR